VNPEPGSALADLDEALNSYFKELLKRGDFSGELTVENLIYDTGTSHDIVFVWKMENGVGELVKARFPALGGFVDATGSKIDLSPLDVHVFRPVSSYEAHPARLLMWLKSSGLEACPTTASIVNQWLPGMTFKGRFSSDVFVLSDLFIPMSPFSEDPFNPVNMRRQKSTNGSGRIVVTDGRLEGPPVREDTNELIPKLAGKGYDFKAAYVSFDILNGAADNWLDYRSKLANVALYGHTTADLKVSYVLALSLMRGIGSDKKRASLPFTETLVPLAVYEGQIKPADGGFKLDYTKAEYVPLTALTASILDRGLVDKTAKIAYEFSLIDSIVGLFAAPIENSAWKWLDGTSPEMDDFVETMRYHRPK
jgi:hypothetical protein